MAWDEGGHNRYAYGPDMGYQIWMTLEYPRLMGEDQDMKIGMTVEKGMLCVIPPSLRDDQLGRQGDRGGSVGRASDSRSNGFHDLSLNPVRSPRKTCEFSPSQKCCADSLS